MQLPVSRSNVGQLMTFPSSRCLFFLQFGQIDENLFFLSNFSAMRKSFRKLSCSVQCAASLSRSNVVTFRSSRCLFSIRPQMIWRLRRFAATSYVVSDHLPSTGTFAGRSASRDKPITRPIPQSARKKKTGHDGPAQPPTRSRSGPDSRLQQRVRWPDRLGSSCFGRRRADSRVS